MWFFLGDKFNGSIIFDIRGQHDVLKVTFPVIRVSKTALGAERRAIMTQFLKYITSSIYRVMPLSSSIHNIAFVMLVLTKDETMIRVTCFDERLPCLGLIC